MLNRRILKSVKRGLMGMFVVLVVGCVGAMAEAEKSEQSSTEPNDVKPARVIRPMVVSTTPVNYANDVSPELDKMTVTFDQPMMDGTWSWIPAGGVLVKKTGEPYYDSSKRTCTLPVEVKPGQWYWVSVNTPYYEDFKNPDGVSAVPYIIVFATKDEDGNPTEILERVVKKAKRLNAKGRAKNLGLPLPTNLQRMVNLAQPGDTVTIPKGVFTESIQIIKPLTLKGESRADCILEVTADRPAIFINTRGKGKVTIEGITIKWQLATNDEGIKRRFAVGVKDTTVELKNCRFQPLGNFQRSPVAVRAMGVSNLIVNACRFEGFEYVVCYGEDTEGTMAESLIMDCGHQGIILYEGSTVRVLRNVITGSKYHAVCSTGGTLQMEDNLIIDNANRGVYLGNKSARGTISNNIIMGNGAGISGFGRSEVKIENNIIADSGYAGIGMRNSCMLLIQNNIFQGNRRGWILLEDGSSNGNTVYRNTFWQNEVDTENFEKAADSIVAEPGFVDPNNGDFSLKPGPALEHKQGLTNPQVFKLLWKRWQNRADSNEPFISVISTSIEKVATEADKRAAENLAADGWQLWKQRKLPEAEKVFKEAVSKDPTNANVWSGLGWSQLNQGKRLSAKASFEKCVEIEPKHPAALNGLGWIAKRQGKTDEAIDYWKKAIEAAPNATAALNGLATTYMELEQYDSAVKYYQMWLKVQPDNADAKAGLEKAKAREQLIPKVAIDPALTWLKLIDDRLYGKSWEQATEYFRETVSKEQWSKAVGAIRGSLGKVISRTVRLKRYTKKLPGAPDGEYVIIQFDTSFENKSSAVETITSMLEEDGFWRASGYFIK